MTLLLELCQTTLLKVNEHCKTNYFWGYGVKSYWNGQITQHQIVDILDEFRNGISNDICQQIELIQGKPGLVRQPGNNAAGVAWCHLWDVPQTFSFPASVKRDVGWRLWLQGMPAYKTVGENGVVEHNKIKAFRVFLPAGLPMKIAKAYYKFALEAHVLDDGEGCWQHSREADAGDCQQPVQSGNIWKQGLVMSLQTTSSITMVGSSQHGKVLEQENNCEEGNGWRQTILTWLEMAKWRKRQRRPSGWEWCEAMPLRSSRCNYYR